ncbi:PAS domain-containing sensor histidine kinase [Chitinimonas lacunae]|uniref:histidine kinase n=1 Tax=Chitinimonas lacunae TaxID=1963018 RepID=A0ABV8MSX4_9NEIS
MNPLPLSSLVPPTNRFLWLWPRIALALFVLAVAGLLWYSQRDALEEQRSVLITDVLWMEQNLHFQFDQAQERLQALARADHEGKVDEAGFRDRATLLLAGSPGVTGVQLFDTAHRRRFSLGPQPELPLDDALKLAAATGRPVYSEVFWDGQEAMLALVVPEQDEFGVGLISLPKLIATQVPWWFTVKYRLQLLDRDNRVLASKSNIETGATPLTYQLALEPPGKGLLLKVSAYPASTGLLRNLLLAAVIGLAAVVLYSWWRLRRHLQRRLQAEAALQAEYAFRKAMEDSLSVGMRARDLDGRIVYVNPALCKMVGYPAEALIGCLPPYPYWEPDSPETLQPHVAPVAGQEARFRHHDGRVVHTMIYTAPLIDAEGRHTGWLSSVVDITEQKRAEAFARQQEEKLQQTARLVSMGEMASTLAHEINQPLMAMSSYASAARQLTVQGDVEQVRPILEKIAGQAQRAAQIVRRIREFVRRRTPHHEPCQLDEVVEDAIGLADGDARSRGARIVARLGAEGLTLSADRILLEQVLLNLIRNALDASDNVASEQRVVEVSTMLEEQGVRVSVRDHGSGISRDAAEHLFEAFYTTKPLGMGMGLNICRSIIENHHGRLWFESPPEGGTLFHFTLPK